MLVDAIAGHRIWARQYDSIPNPLLALETRVLGERLGDVAGKRILDAGSGTGRWMQWASERQAHALGIDACEEMLHEAARKPGLKGRSALADIRNIPLRNHAFDLAICSFTLGYLPFVAPAVAELARVARCLILTDLHPTALASGWNRSFKTEGEVYELVNYTHSPEAPRALGLMLKWRTEASFGEPERAVFQAAGKEELFETLLHIPAIVITAWTGTSN